MPCFFIEHDRTGVGGFIFLRFSHLQDYTDNSHIWQFSLEPPANLSNNKGIVRTENGVYQQRLKLKKWR
ncbi:MAG: hypothetical protein KAU21_06665, partial [Gammaproteobacteria bacterium]|nr:hypothetical protein [Gammaproteobacteria bacterium]